MNHYTHKRHIIVLLRVTVLLCLFLSGGVASSQAPAVRVDDLTTIGLSMPASVASLAALAESQQRLQQTMRVSLHWEATGWQGRVPERGQAEAYRERGDFTVTGLKTGLKFPPGRFDPELSMTRWLVVGTTSQGEIRGIVSIADPRLLRVERKANEPRVLIPEHKADFTVELPSDAGITRITFLRRAIPGDGTSGRLVSLGTVILTAP